MASSVLLDEVRIHPGDREENGIERAERAGRD
jgi:hypothetical protein